VHQPSDLRLTGCGAVRVTSHRTAPSSRRQFRLHFGDEPVPDGLEGQVSVCGKIVQPDRIDVEFCTPLDGD
jgi:hypothetical protein